MRLLTLSTYRIDAPRHGGQIRLNAINRVLSDAGWEIRHLAVYSPNASDNDVVDDWYFPLDEDFGRYLSDIDGRPDVDVSQFMIDNDERYFRAISLIEDFDPDIIWLEQPWLWPFVKKILDSNKHRQALIVYGSQNIESNLISEVLSQTNSASRSRLIEKTFRIEEDLCQTADAIVAVSFNDRDYFLKYEKATRLFKNGVWPRGNEDGREYWANALKNYNIALFIGSAHPPNADGFISMTGENLSYLSPSNVIVVAGGVSNLITQKGFYKNNRGLNISRMIMTGSQDNGGLSSLIGLAKCIILPITNGGGTNLKTAEALYNRKPIIATSIAMRGYENYVHFPGISIVDDQENFGRTLVEYLDEKDQKPLIYSEEQEDLLENLLWTFTLRGMDSWLKKLRFKEKRQNYSRTLSHDVDAFYEKETVKLFDATALRRYLVDGWHDFEESGTWNSKDVSIIKIPIISIEYSEMTVEIEIEAFVPFSRKLTVDVMSASKHHFTKTFTNKNKFGKMIFKISKDDIVKNFLYLSFCSSYVLSPSLLNISIDRRSISFNIKHVKISVGA